LALGDEAEPVWPLALEQVVGGTPAELAPGAPALHVVFFAIWCPPCLDELRRLAALEERWGGEGYRLAIVAVQNRTTRDRLLRFVDAQAPPGTLLFDRTGAAQRAFGVEELPAHFLYDRAGRRVGSWGALNAELEDAVRTLLEPQGEGD
jgi:thiol-disulfide isomerase/thioredoxin